MTNSKRRGWWLFGMVAGLAVIVGLTATVWLASSDQSSAADQSDHPASDSLRPEAVSVSIAPVTFRPIQRTVEAVGTFSGFEEVTVMAEVAGRVVKIHHEVGDIVRPGDVLMDIDRTDYELEAEEARSALLAELTRLGLSELPKGQFDITQHPMVRRAIEQEQNAKRKLDRGQQLHQQRTISQEELEQLQTDYMVAGYTRAQTLMDAQAILAAARNRAATLASAMDRLEKTRLAVQPSDLAAKVLGDQVEYVVTAREVSEGEMVKDSPNASMVAFEMVIDKLLKLHGNIPERHIGQVKAGQKVEVRVEAYPDRVFAGTVNRVSPTVDRLSRTFEIEVLVPNATGELRPGGFGKLAVLTHEDPQAVTVPVEAVVSFAGSTKVFVADKGVARAVPVRTASAGRGWVEVVPTGELKLDRNSQVIASGQQQLADGVAIRIRADETAKP